MSIYSSATVFVMTSIAIHIDGYFEYNGSEVFITVNGNDKSKELLNYFEKSDEYIELNLTNNMTDYCIYLYEIINQKAKLTEVINSNDLYTH